MQAAEQEEQKEKVLLAQMQTAEQEEQRMKVLVTQYTNVQGAIELLEQQLHKIDDEIASLDPYNKEYLCHYRMERALGGDYDHLITRLRSLSPDSRKWDANSLSSIEDQIRILEAMRDAGILLERGLGSLFKHADNIRFLFVQQRSELPQWYFDKYHSKFY